VSALDSAISASPARNARTIAFGCSPTLERASPMPRSGSSGPAQPRDRIRPIVRRSGACQPAYAAALHRYPVVFARRSRVPRYRRIRGLLASRGSR
jgi:hypothetical protein